MSKGILKQSISCDNVLPVSPPIQQTESLTSSRRNVSFKDGDDLVQKLIIPGRKLTRSLTLPPSSEAGYIFSPTRKARFFVGCDIGEETETSSSSSSSSENDTDDEEANILAAKQHKIDKHSSQSYQARLARSKRRRRRVIIKIIGITVFLLLTFSLFFFKPGFEGKQARPHHHRNRPQQPTSPTPQHHFEQNNHFFNQTTAKSTTDIINE